MELLTITRHCPICGIPQTVQVPKDGYERWTSGGTVIQKALPTLTPNERELLQTGICPPCWDRFAAMEEEEEE